ncbi:MAG TPA: hypothetical protein VKE22_28070 [Haliangiales bacterium]|nr:hypothetical protein [Haliangiales bacterium]
MRLTTWPEVHRHLAATYADVRAERDGVLDIVVPLRDAAAPATPGAAPLAVSRTEVLGSTWIDVSSVIGSLRHLSQAEMLANNAASTIGAFCTRDGELVVRQRLPLAGLRAADLDETIRDIAELAAWSRRRLSEMGVPVAPWRGPGDGARRP